MSIVGDINEGAVILMMTPTEAHGRIKSSSFYAIRCETSAEDSGQIEGIKEITKGVFGGLNSVIGCSKYAYCLCEAQGEDEEFFLSHEKYYKEIMDLDVLGELGLRLEDK